MYVLCMSAKFHSGYEFKKFSSNRVKFELWVSKKTIFFVKLSKVWVKNSSNSSKIIYFTSFQVVILPIKKRHLNAFFKSMHFFNRKLFFWRIIISENEFHCCYCQTSYLLMKRSSEQQLSSRIVQNQSIWFVSFQLKNAFLNFFFEISGFSREIQCSQL